MLNQMDIQQFERARDRSDASRFRVLKQAIRSGSSMATVQASKVAASVIGLDEDARAALVADGVTDEPAILIVESRVDDERFDARCAAAMKAAHATGNMERIRAVTRSIDDERRFRSGGAAVKFDPHQTHP